nr:helix-turn-helix domain-containing protein [uncultured Anaerosporobacter sp.]
MKKTKTTPFKINGERDFSLHLSNLDQHDKIAKIAKALSSPTRLKIINILKNTTMSIQEISDTLDIPASSTALHIKNLEEAGLIITESQPGMHGSMRVCTCSMQSLYLQTFDSETDSTNNMLTMDIPIGSYFQCEISPTCGLADENGIIDTYDNVKSFYSPQRMHAQLIWFQKGFIEYRFPNIDNPLLDLHELSFLMEICSEAPGYQEVWPSDITISINGYELHTYRSPGDYGARGGKLTPSTWPNGRTQYGLLKTFSVRNDGGYLDGELVNRNINIDLLDIQKNPYITLRIEIKESARYVGGINIFGEKYGDYPQGITMQMVY